jgi:HSP20 family protein
MSIVRYDPWRMMHQLQNELNTLFQAPRTGGNEDVGTIVTSDWTPAVDIKEEDKRYLVIADIPGVDPKNIEVHMEDGILSIKGEKKTEVKEEKEGYKRVERTYGSFHRRFSLPDNADAENISAKSLHGTLEISIPKKEAAALSRRIKVEH